MDIFILGIGELGATARPGTGLKTFALGSCVAVLLLDPSTRCVGMAHVALPDSSIKPEKARIRPGHFADTGIPTLLKQMLQAGAGCEHRGYIAKLVGGASVMDPNNTFNIGIRNVSAIKSILNLSGIRIASEDVGRRISRTVSVDVDTGTVLVSSPGRPDWRV